MAKINVTSGTASAYGQGELQLQNKAPMDSTLRPVTDSANTASPLNLSTSLVQTTSTLKITTNDNPYIDAEDGAGNNRFTVGRDTGSQQVNVDFASNPGGSTTIVGAIRTYVDGVTLSEVMAFREDGNIGINTLTPGAKLDIHSASNVIMQLNRTGAGKSWLQYLQAGTARWNTGYDNTNGNFTIYDAVNAADRMVVTNAGNVGIGTTTPAATLDVSGTAAISGTTTFNGGQSIIYASFANDAALFQRVGDYGSVIRLGRSGVSNSATIDYPADGTFAFSTVTAERMRITAAGNVGIGTTTPTQKLEVVNSANGTSAGFAGTTYGVRIDNGGTFSSGRSTIFGVNSTFFGSYQPLSLQGSNLFFGVNGNDKAEIDANYLRLLSGTGGIQFNGNTAAANALDDYEEGTWTMGIAFGGGSTGVIYGQNTGTYTKIGRQVTVNGYISLTNKGSSTGNASITGLPFTVGSLLGNYQGVTFGQVFNLSNTGFINAFANLSSTIISLQSTTTVGTLSSLTDVNFSNNTEFMISFTYFV